MRLLIVIFIITAVYIDYTASQELPKETRTAWGEIIKLNSLYN
jgi:biopolymer transport protein ExbD